MNEATPAPVRLTRTQEWALAVTTAVVTANAFCIHPIIGEVARGFGIDATTIGLVPALNQLALALGILLLLPLGDFLSNRRLCLRLRADAGGDRLPPLRDAQRKRRAQAAPPPATAR